MGVWGYVLCIYYLGLFRNYFDGVDERVCLVDLGLDWRRFYGFDWFIDFFEYDLGYDLVLCGF